MAAEATGAPGSGGGVSGRRWRTGAPRPEAAARATAVGKLTS
ncbi:MAG TPA: hypothetical protein VH141_12385 [Pseudonocardia sp.]|nr:hypothetical protein [Pseudonocardia sp.]